MGSVDTLLLMFRNSLSTSWRRAATESAILDVDTGPQSSSVKSTESCSQTAEY